MEFFRVDGSMYYYNIDSGAMTDNFSDATTTQPSSPSRSARSFLHRISLPTPPMPQPASPKSPLSKQSFNTSLRSNSRLSNRERPISARSTVSSRSLKSALSAISNRRRSFVKLSQGTPPSPSTHHSCVQEFTARRDSCGKSVTPSPSRSVRFAPYVLHV